MPHTYPEYCVFSSVDDIKGSHVTVMGLGLNGGGEASVRFFLKHGAYVVATDTRSAEQLRPTIDSIAADLSLDISRLSYRLGGHDIKDFKDADCVIKNPAVKYEGNKYLAASKSIETDVSIFLRFTKAPIIAVTGSKGKSSTVSAVHYCLCHSGIDSFLGGNITVSPLTFLEKTSEETPVVLELSSWQLADLRGRKVLKPHIALITKIVPDHQNWYNDMESYVSDKRLIYADQTESDYTIVDADSDEVGTGPECGGTWGDLFAIETHGQVLRYSKNKLPDGVFGAWQEYDGTSFIGKARVKECQVETVFKALSVPGAHARANVLNASLILKLLGIPASKIAHVLSQWTGIPHRMQRFHLYRHGQYSLVFYNDSCSTVPEAAAAASQSFGYPVILIAGGTDKELSFAPLAATLACARQSTIPVKALYLLAGTGTDKLISLLKESRVPYNGPYTSLDELLADIKDFAASHMGKNAKEDIVVFSPGATSFGMFKNEFDRGEQFMEKVRSIFK